MSRIGHLVRRTWLSLVDRRVLPEDRVVVRSVLTDKERELWERMSHVDQRHSVRVLRRFDARLTDARRDERAAVLLHDVGKSESNLGTFRRILATAGVDRSNRARSYRRHEELGREMLSNAGVDSVVIRNLQGEARQQFAVAFKAADDE